MQHLNVGGDAKERPASQASIALRSPTKVVFGVVSAIVLGSFACSTPNAPLVDPGDAGRAASSGPMGASTAPVSALAAYGESSARVTPIQWIEDDLEAARAQALREGKRLFVDVWAPWCHTCLAMKTGALRDPALQRLSAGFVFVALDSDRPSNAAFMARYEVPAWPSFFVIDPKDDRALGFIAGGASAAELVAMMQGSSDGGADGEMLLATQAFVSGQYARSAEHYERAARLGVMASSTAPDRAGVGQMIIGWVRALYKSGDYEQCAKIGRDWMDRTSGAAAPADVTYYTLKCVEHLGKEHAGLATEARAKSIQRLTAITHEPSAEASVDDRADAWAQLAAAHRDGGDEAGALRADRARLDLMENAAEAADDPMASSVYDYQRAGAYLALGRGELAVKMLVAREKQLPTSYEPPARLAWVLGEMDRHEEALVAITRAIDRAYGPRRLRYLRMRLDSLTKLGRIADAEGAANDWLRFHDALPATQQRPDERKEVAALLNNRTPKR